MGVWKKRLQVQNTNLFSSECLETDDIADGYCDDIANTEICNWDGGDCCGPNSNLTYCTECQCQNTTTPTSEAPPTTATPTTAQASTYTSGTTIATTAGECNNLWSGDNTCDDINNNMECGYDGGDCCGCDVQTDYCTECQCLDPNGSGGGTTCPPITTTTVPTTNGGGGTYLLWSKMLCVIYLTYLCFFWILVIELFYPCWNSLGTSFWKKWY